MPGVRVSTKPPFVWLLSPARHGAPVSLGVVSARLRRLARLGLLLGLIASATPAYAAGPRPDPAPVTPTKPQPTHTYTPPVTTHPSTTTARTSTHKKATVRHKHKKPKKKPARVTPNSKPVTTTANPQAAGVHESAISSGSTTSEALKMVVVILAGVGVAGTLLVGLGILYVGVR